MNQIRLGSRIHPRHRRSLIVGTALAAAAAVCLAACGSSGSSGGGSGKATDISFGDLSPNISLTPFYAAVYEGFFKKAGLNVTIQSFQGGGSTSSAALATGAVQVASGGPTNFIGSIAQNVIKGKLFAESADTNYDLVTTKDISSVDDLKGKTLGVSGTNSSDEIAMLALLNHYGITQKDVTLITAGTTAERLTALSTGKVDGIMDIASFRKSEEAVGKVLVPAEKNPVSVPTVAFYANDDYIKNHADVLKKFTQVVAKAATWVKTPANQSAAIKDCEKGSGSTEDECLQNIQAAKDPSRTSPYTWSKTFAVNPKGIQDALNATSLVIPAAKKLTVNDVADLSIAGKQP